MSYEPARATSLHERGGDSRSFYAQKSDPKTVPILGCTCLCLFLYLFLYLLLHLLLYWLANPTLLVAESAATLFAAAFHIANLPPSSHISILTGFPCLTTVPPTETDGLNGALALARSLIHLGFNVTILTDECNEDVMFAGVAGIGEWSGGGRLTLESFPPEHKWGDDEATRLIEIATSCCDHVIAIERPSPASDGNCYTMKGRVMNEDVAPLHQLIALASEHNPEVKVTAIGDGGNELGMGKVYDKIIASEIPDAKKIAATVGCDWLIVAAVSNWGGYALGAAAAVCRFANTKKEERGATSEEVVRTCLPSGEEETAILERVVAAGARDGILKVEGGVTVDGLSLEDNLKVLKEITGLAGSVVA